MNDKSSSNNNNHSECNRYPLNNHDNIVNEPIIRRRVVRRNQQHQYGLRANYAKDITSQNGEDGIIERIFQLIHNPTTTAVGNDEEQQHPTLQEKDEDTEGHQQERLWCVDVGAWDGIHLSNTRQLLLQQNVWNGVLIEADNAKFQSLQQLYQYDNPNYSNTNINSNNANNSTNDISYNDNNTNDSSHNDTANEQQLLHQDQEQIVHCINATVSAMDDSDNTLTNILNRSNTNNKNAARIPYDIDFLCIDVDGIDYWILYNVLSCNMYRPKCICIEFNPTMPYDLIYIPPKNDTVRHGCSLPALVELCEQYNYVLIEITLYNAFFVPKQTIFDKYLKSHLPPYDPLDPIGSVVGAGSTSTMMQQPSMSTVLYQLYDGTLKLWGCKKLLWHRIPMEEEKVQMIPKQKRSFPFAPSSSSNHQDFRQCDSANNHTTTTTFDYSHVVDVSSYLCNEKDCNDVMLKQEHCSNLLVQQLQKNNGFCYVTMNGGSTANNDDDSILSTELCQQGLYWTNKFLQVSDETVRRSCLSSVDRAKRGYSPMNTENFGSLLGRSDVSNDLVRKFRIGSKTKYTNTDNNNRSMPKDEITEKEKRNASNNSLLQPNIWPSKDVWDDTTVQQFRSALEEYYEKASFVAQLIVRAICDGLLRSYPDLKDSLSIFLQHHEQQKDTSNTNTNSPTCATTETAIDEDNAAREDESNQYEVAHDDDSNGVSTCSTSSSSSTILTILGYRPNSTRHKGKQKGRPLVAAHTDVGIITMLLFDDGDCASLQRRKYDDDDSRWNTNDNDGTNRQYRPNDGEEQWVDVTLPHLTSNNEPIFVINIADCLSDITGGILPSALHRVIPKPGLVQRNCCALFVGLNPKEVIQIGNERMTYEEWRKRRIDRARQALLLKE